MSLTFEKFVEGKRESPGHVMHELGQILCNRSFDGEMTVIVHPDVASEANRRVFLQIPEGNSLPEFEMSIGREVKLTIIDLKTGVHDAVIV